MENNPYTPPPPHQDDEITLKDLILKVQEYWRVLLTNWWVIALFCIPTTAYFMYKHFTFVPTYQANLRFVVEGQGGTGGGFASLLGQFGISRGSQNINPYKIIEVGRSPEITRRTILNTLPNGSLVGNSLIDLYEHREKWAKSDKPEMAGFMFTDKFELTNRQDASVFKSLHSLLWGSDENRSNALMSLNLDEDSGIFNISANTKDEDLSLLLANDTYEEVKSFFERELLKNQIESAEILKIKVDSIKGLLDSKTYSMGRFEDSNRGLISGARSSQSLLLQRDVQALATVYGEAMKTYEMADYELQSTRPLFKAIDRPFGPLNPKSSSLLITFIKSILFGGILGVVVVLVRHIYRVVINS